MEPLSKKWSDMYGIHSSVLKIHILWDVALQHCVTG
jgi:hypothetical protein